MQMMTTPSQRLRHGLLRIPAGAALLALALTGCGSGADGGADDGAAKDVAEVAASSTPSPTGLRKLALMGDEEKANAGAILALDVLDNDSVTLESGVGAGLLDAYDATELTLTVDTAPEHGTASVSGPSITYTAEGGYGGEDSFTYRVLLTGTEIPAATAVVRITVNAPTSSPSPTPTPTPTTKAVPKATTPATVYYKNCDAVRAAGAAPVEEGDPGYAPHLDRDGDGVGCEPSSGSASSSGGGGGTSGGGGDSGGTSGGGGGSSTYYANCTAVRAAGAAPIRAGDPGYGRHLDRDGDGVACE